VTATEREDDVAAALRLATEAVGRREGALLVAPVLDTDRRGLVTHPSTAVPPEALRRLRRMVRARRRGVPFAYVVGGAGFWDMELEVGPGVLVPRPESEHLVECVRDDIATGASACTVADIGTGSGAIAIAIARAVPTVDVVATDRSLRALVVAARNAGRWAPAVRLLPAGDLLRPLVRAGIRADVVVMNPPYVRTRDLARLAREVRREPQRALDGGPDGLAVVRRLLAAIGRGEAVRAGARVWLEVGAGQAEAVEVLVRALGGPTRVVRDLAGIDRVVGGSWQP
jgi:release factor glutamine methyltransferase